MDLIDFSKNIPSDQLAVIFKDFFEQHMLTYSMLEGIQFGDINTSVDKSSIMYSIKLLNEDDRNQIVSNLNNIPLNIYGKTYTPNVYINGDLLCITLNK